MGCCNSQDRADLSPERRKNSPLKSPYSSIPVLKKQVLWQSVIEKYAPEDEEDKELYITFEYYKQIVMAVAVQRRIIFGE